MAQNSVGVAGTYTAWNGQDYPWPPPAGWQQRSDGRYWPLTNVAGATSSPGLTVPPPPGAHARTAAPGANMGFPGVGPYQEPGKPYYVDPRNQSHGLLWAVLGFCVMAFGLLAVPFDVPIGPFTFGRDGNLGGDLFGEDRAIDFVDAPALPDDEQAQLSDDNIERLIKIDQCGVVGGRATARGTVENDVDGPRGFSITMSFTTGTGERLFDGFADVDAESGETIEFTAVSPSSDVIAGDIDCEVDSVFRFFR